MASPPEAIARQFKRARFALDPVSFAGRSLEARGEDLLALGIENDDDVLCFRRGILDQHAHAGHGDNLRAARQRHRFGQRDADAQAGERTRTGGDVELLDLARSPVLCADQAIENGNDLGGMLQAVREPLFGEDGSIVKNRKRSDSA